MTYVINGEVSTMFLKKRKSLLTLLAAFFAAVLLCVGAALLTTESQKAYAAEGDVAEAYYNTGVKIGTYATVEDAWNSLNSSGTVKLIADASATSELSSGNSQTAITLDLNGHVLTVSQPIRCARLTLKDSMAGTVDSAYLHNIPNPRTENATDTVQIYGGVLTNPTGNALNVGSSYVVRMESGTVAGCASTGNGGAVCVDGGYFTMDGGTVCDNTAANGGGVYVKSGTFEMNCTATITVNKAKNTGGGVYVNTGTFKVKNAVNISCNTSGESAKADNVYLSQSSKITVTDRLVYGDKKASISINPTYKFSGAFTSGYGENNKYGDGNIIAPDNYFVADTEGVDIVLNSDGEVETFAEGVFPATWKSTFNNNDSLPASADLTEIVFAGTAPDGYSDSGISFNGIHIYFKNGDNTKVAFVYSDTINAPQDSSRLFASCGNLTSVDFSNFNTASVTNMNYMFYECKKLISLDLSGFDTANVTGMESMFSFCHELTSVNLSGFNTAKVTDMGFMFCYCYKLTSVDLSDFNTANVTKMRHMFGACNSITSLDLSTFDATKVTNLERMLSCSYLNTVTVSASLAQKLHDTTDDTQLYGYKKETWYGEKGETFTNDNRFSKAGTYTTIPFMVTVGSTVTRYNDFNEAWAAANNAGTATVTMFADADIAETLVVSKTANITLEMKKHKLEYTGESGSVIQVNGTFLVQQGNTDGVSSEHKITNPVTGQEATVYDSLITGGKGSGDNKLGGGVFVAEGGKFTLGYYVTVAGNTGGYGGGVRVDDNATFIMNESARITHNKATYDGGGLCVFNAAEVTLKEGSIEYNAAAAGGGIYFEGGSADYTVKGTSVANNVVTTNGEYGGRGGGIYIDGSSVLLDTGRMDEYGPVRANTATVCGGGVFVSENGKLKVHGSVYIADNTKDGQNNNVYLDGSAKIEVSEAFRYLNIYVNNTGDVATGFFSEDLPSRVFKSDDEANNCVWISDAATGTVHVGHTGGTATCQTKATCEKCNQEYGELGAHNYDADHLCTVCGETEKIYWGISDGKLLISGVSGAVATNSFDYDAVFETYDAAPWYNDRASITSVEFDGENGVAPNSLKYWFSGCSELTNIDFSGLNTSYVTDMFSMFSGCTKLVSLDLSRFDTTKVTDMSDMFFQCSALTSLDLSAFDFTNVTNMRCMFRNCTALNEIVFPTEVNAQKVTAVDYMFENCKGMTSIDLSAFKTKELTNMSRMFLGCSLLTSVTFSASFDTAKVTNMSQLFQSCTALTSPGISGFNTESVTTMENLFAECAGLTSLDLTNLNMQNVTKMRSMFNGCTNLTDIIFPTVFNTAKVTDMAFLFSRCGALKKIDLTSFNTESLTVMEGMFYTCGELQEVNLSSFDAQNVTNANYMFYGCNALNKVIAPAKIGESFSTALPSVKFWNGAADVTYIDNTGAGKTFVKHDEHSLTAVAQKNATCTEAGVLAHDHCSICGKDFIENVEKSAEQLVIAKTAHEWEAEFTVDKAATCTESGSKSKHCSHCGEKSEVTEIAAKGHHLAHHAAVEANTEAAGNTEYWSCAECDKYFSDSEGATEIADKSSVVIPKLPEPTPGPAPASKNKPLDALWITLIVILSVVIVGEVGYIVYRQVRKNKVTEDKE